MGVEKEVTVLKDYLRQHAIHRIIVISPHLDDAAFSLAAFLQLPDLPQREVITVFTEARADSDSQHTRAMGFENPLIEFKMRRQEDKAAMDMMGVPFVHLGVEADRFTEVVVDEVIDRALGGKNAGNALVLLPAGAGGVLSKFERVWRQLMRRPMGCPSHGDHERVRDEIGRACVARQAKLGFYAEVPYQWASSPKSMVKTIKQICQSNFLSIHIRPDVDNKLAVAKAYTSQFRSEFGGKLSYQKRTMAIPELLFLSE